MTKMSMAENFSVDTVPHIEPICTVGPNQSCRHSLVDQELNEFLHIYEELVRSRFSAITDTLKTLSIYQHELDFVTRAQRIAMDHLHYKLPLNLLEDSWVSGLNLRALHSYCIFRSFKECIAKARFDQASWRERNALNTNFLHSCGYHTVNISPCADGRLQGLLSFVLRLVPSEAVYVKAYAGAMFNIEEDITNWAHRELERLTGGLPGDEDRNYLKIAVYHYSSSNPSHEGCAAHGSDNKKAVEAALMRLNELRAAINNTYGRGAAPDILLIGVDTDIDSIRVHIPDANGDIHSHRFVDSGDLYRESLGMTQEAARMYIADAVTKAECQNGLVHNKGKMAAGMRSLVFGLLEANLSQIEYVIQYHAGRYAVIGHNERFICAGEAMNELHLRNKFYFAHLNTVEEGAIHLDVGIKIFTNLNIKHGLAIPILVHYHYSSRVPGARERVIQRCRRVKAAIEARYSQLHEKGLLYCQIAISDKAGSERCTFIEDEIIEAEH
ncbi:Carboxysome shell carbonic anhydrase [Nitrosomonas nitrosa]|jgi:carboxysome shell carbonic anhydrase|uniref:Carboxysome shell carbonic anhydrase n=1 Tax=Nitrosomonas nitrosa TaxID=52442 RepID=A0A8H8YXN3_9PROT|nr:carboxysome shell carbonic anhydrase [Nitrosomonas nitrosa]CAE6492494.1 Carboxysome shell carbonic anhydrase [Nitrosomonas nitrosa]